MSLEILELLKSGADANTKDSRGFSLLMIYAKKNDINSMKLLLEYGAQVNMKDYIGYTALDYAIIEGHLDAVKFLIGEVGAKISNDNYMLAVRQNQKHIINYFDSLDEDKKIFLKKKNY